MAFLFVLFLRIFSVSFLDIFFALYTSIRSKMHYFHLFNYYIAVLVLLINNAGSISEKREEIDRYVWGQFKEARENMQQVHNNDLIRW